jgi:hypothetical protein
MIKGYIYKVVNDIDDKIYVGSTELKLNDRYNHHKSECRNGSKKKVHIHMRNVGIDHCRIELIEEVEVKEKEELYEEEQKYITELKPKLNKNKAYTELKGKQYQQQYNQQYYREHADEIKQHNQQYNQQHADEIKQYKQQNINKYNCEACDYHTYNKSNYTKHCNSKRHIYNVSH